MNEELTAFCAGVGATLFLTIFVGGCSHQQGRNQAVEDAVKNQVGEWRISDPETGKAKFNWKTADGKLVPATWETRK